MRARTHLALVCAAIFSQSNMASAQSAPFGECRSGYWSANRNLDDREDIAKATCFVNWRPSLGDGVRLNVNARAGFGDSGDSVGTHARLREGFLEVESGPWTWRAGRQIIAWGRADRINPTDSLAPRDFTLLVPDDDEQRNGIDAGVARYQLSKTLSISTSILKFEPNRMPQGSLPPNLVRSRQPNRAEFAVKLDNSASDTDWSVSYFDGVERSPRYGLQVASAPVFRSAYERTRSFGADFAIAHNASTIRGELSHARVSQNCESEINCTHSPRKLTRAVVGADRDFLGTANVNVQLFATVHDYRDPAFSAASQRPLLLALNRLNSEFAKHEWGMTFRFSDRFINDQLKLELTAITEFVNRSTLLRPRASYAFTDSIRLSVGADHFRGGEQTYFGSRKKNNVAYVELGVLF